MDESTNVRYLKGIAENDYLVLQEIYKESLPEVVKYVKQNSGTLDDAKDVFQEGILAIYKKVVCNNLVLTTPFHVFLFIVCKRMWLKKIKRRSLKEVPFEHEEVFGFEDDYDEAFLKSRKWALFNKKFKQLAEECQKVLKMLFDKRSSKEIAEVMGYSEDYAKRKKYKCKISLAELIKSDPEYHYIIES